MNNKVHYKAAPAIHFPLTHLSTKEEIRNGKVFSENLFTLVVLGSIPTVHLPPVKSTRGNT